MSCDEVDNRLSKAFHDGFGLITVGAESCTWHGGVPMTLLLRHAHQPAALP
jgi:hypothetical protein